MKKRYLTGKWELSCLIINLIIYKSFTDAPRRFMAAGSAAFLSAFISAVITYLFIWFLPCLYKKTGVKNIFELLEKKRYATLAAGIIITVYLVFSSAHALEALVTFSKIAAFPSAPFAFIAIFFVAAFAAAVSRGMESCIRPHAFIVPFCIFMIVLMLSAVVRYFDATNLLPVLGKGTANTLYTSVKNLPYFFDFVLVFLINPFVEDEKSFKHTVRIAGAVGIGINLLIILSANLIIPYPASEEIEFPVYQIMKNVYFGRFFQRIDAAYLLSVALSGMAYLSFAAFLMTYTFKQAFGLSKNRPFVWSFAFIILFLSLLIHKKAIGNFYNLLLIFETAAAALIILTPTVFFKKGRINK